MVWVMVRNEGDIYLYTYLQSGTGATGEYPPVLPIPRVPTITVNLPEICEKIAYRYYRTLTGTIGQRPVLPVQLPLVHITAKMSFAGKKTYRYYRTFTGTTGQDRYYR
jgi:hypothetical protein